MTSFQRHPQEFRYYGRTMDTQPHALLHRTVHTIAWQRIVCTKQGKVVLSDGKVTAIVFRIYNE